jgi:GNAT superfamily N-acetyltransferase
MDMDKAQLSRLIARLRTRGLVSCRASADHGRRLLLTLTPSGRKAFGELDQAAAAQMGGLLAPLSRPAQARLVGAMRTIEATLVDPQVKSAAPRLRSLEVGDLGWIIHRQSVLYHEEYGWDWTYEGLVAQILSEFVAQFDAAREDAWVAEHAGAIVGSVFLVKGAEPGVAKLRLLYVEPGARGLGIGSALVAACIARARELGYRTLTLWTNDVLVSARRIYEAAGFKLVEQNRHRSFGHDLVGQVWRLDLEAAARALEPLGTTLRRTRRAGSSTTPASSARRRSR